jgi:nucleotide-binding universal stress UspA family protein
MYILYATDGSEEALDGARLLASLPLDPDCRLTLLTVLQDEDDRSADAALAPARALLQHTLASIDTQVRRGAAAEEILRAAEEQPPDLLVVGSRGVSGLTRFFVGSVAERIARHAPCSVLLARPITQALRQVIVGIDGSEDAERAAEWLKRFPLPDGCTVRCVTVMPFLEALSPSRKLQWPAEFRALYEQERDEARQTLDTLAESFTAAGKESVAELRSGDPADSLIQCAEEHDADLIVVGPRGISRIERFLLGSVSQRLIHHAPCSVAVVR